MEEKFDGVDGSILEAALASEQVAVYVDVDGEYRYGMANGEDVSLEDLVNILVLEYETTAVG